MSGTFLGFNITWDMTGFNRESFDTNAVFPPLQFGGGFDIKINPPDECEENEFVSPFIGYKHLGAGTNVRINEDAGAIDLDFQGFNFSIGTPDFIPFGATFPDPNN